MNIEISIDDQELRLIDHEQIVRRFPISSGLKGVGSQPGSYRTPTGKFIIREKIGADQPSGMRFDARMPVGIWDSNSTCADPILSRILRLHGEEDHNANTFDRYIYIHGTSHEDLLGQPASHGCIRMANADVIELFDAIEEGTPVIIHAPVRSRGNIIFIDCDSTLSSIEGIDELARARGTDVHAMSVALTDAAMNGELPLHEVFPRRMELIRPDRHICERVADLYVETILPGAKEAIQHLKSLGWLPVIVSGGFRPLILPLARELGIEHVEAVPLLLDGDGNYAGYGQDYPTTHNFGKNEIIREWKAALLPERTVMIGDGISDLETRSDVDWFVGFGGVAARDAVKHGCDQWSTSWFDFAHVSTTWPSRGQAHL